MTNPVLEYERRRLAAKLESGWEKGLRAEPVAAAAGVSMQDVMRAWYPEQEWDDASQKKRRWPEDAPGPALRVLVQYPVHPIVELYYVHLRRPPDPEGLAYWIGELERGVPMPDLRKLWLLGAAKEISERADQN